MKGGESGESLGGRREKNSMNKSRNIKKRREKEGVEEKGGGLSKGRDRVK